MVCDMAPFTNLQTRAYKIKNNKWEARLKENIYRGKSSPHFENIVWDCFVPPPFFTPTTTHTTNSLPTHWRTHLMMCGGTEFIEMKHKRPPKVARQPVIPDLCSRIITKEFFTSYRTVRFVVKTADVSCNPKS